MTTPTPNAPQACPVCGVQEKRRESTGVIIFTCGMEMYKTDSGKWQRWMTDCENATGAYFSLLEKHEQSEAAAIALRAERDALAVKLAQAERERDEAQSRALHLEEGDDSEMEEMYSEASRDLARANRELTAARASIARLEQERDDARSTVALMGTVCGAELCQNYARQKSEIAALTARLTRLEAVAKAYMDVSTCPYVHEDYCGHCDADFPHEQHKPDCIFLLAETELRAALATAPQEMSR